MFLILTLIILVAAFNIISSQIMLVKDKGAGHRHPAHHGRDARHDPAHLLHDRRPASASSARFGGGPGDLCSPPTSKRSASWIQALTGTKLFQAGDLFPVPAAGQDRPVEVVR